MTDDTPNGTPDNDLFAQDEASAHRFVAGRTGTGKIDCLIELAAAAHAESAPEWFDPKADHEDGTTGGDS
ncbi:hypothetical protein [Halococcus salifodinae]|uniref:Uncharacterized protein n=1 Tax=Halococcus salifodinae DSM 8989 TaxID=1227456 RepID=M0NB39_9EURY|nr:hypothetical protein [Halococcus salifodinae]EMA54788.1 hypothetical protein C450_04978 [Halococcus salifodinae DSM 8989]